MTGFKKVIAAAKAKVADAKAKEFLARLEAIDAILDGCEPRDAMMLAAHVLAGAAPICCEAHQDEFRAEFLQMLAERIDMEAQDAAEADEAAAAHTSVH